MGLFNKKELEEIKRLENMIGNLRSQLSEINGWELKEVNDEISKKNIELAKTNEKISNLMERIDNLDEIIKEKEYDISLLNLEIEGLEFGLYNPKYSCMNSDEYSNKIKDIREKQKSMIKSKTALNYYDRWVLDGDRKKGAAMNNDNMKMYLRSFNSECDVLILKAKYNNVEKIHERIVKAAKDLDKLNERNKISVTKKYLDLKIEELYLVHEYNIKKQEEKEAMRAAKEEEKELFKVQKEIEEKRKSIKKEREHYMKAKEKLESQLKNASEDKIKDIVNKIEEINNNLETIDKNLKDVDYREANSKAGYVYVISNIGSFGEGVYKIGMTRRLEPQDRVDELGDASVPFRFDVHAMIFSDDAPALEAALHKTFDDYKVNMVNSRKEFFKVPLEEIEKAVKKNHDKLVEFNYETDAEQYRESIKIRESK